MTVPPKITVIESFTHKFVRWSGTTAGLMVAMLSILFWLCVGWEMQFTDSWKSDVELYVGIVTFIMIFLFQRAQYKDLAAIHAKLNELISATTEADNRIIAVDELSEGEISQVKQNHLSMSKTDNS